MVTDLLLPQLAFRALSDDPDGNEEEVDTDLGDGDIDEKDEDAEGEEDLAAAGFGIEDGSEESAE